MSLISNVLTPAVNLWLRSQLDQVESLEFKILGTNRQILSGYIPEVHLKSNYPVYQGINLGQVEVKAETIRVNLAEVLKGKPLRLLEPISVTGTIKIAETALQDSLKSPLLKQALTDLFHTFLPDAPKGEITWKTIRITPDKLTIQGLLQSPNQSIPIIIRSGLNLTSHRSLTLHPLEVEALPWQVHWDNYLLDLGSQIHLNYLSVEQEVIHCQGSTQIIN